MSSSPKNEASAAAAPAIRRFAPVPVETSSRSSRKRPTDKTEDTSSEKTVSSNGKASEPASEQSEDSASKPRRFLPQPVEMTSKSNRKKLPEPIEISVTKSSNRWNKSNEDSPSETDSQKPPRRFLPQPVETTSRRRGGRNSRNLDTEDEDMLDVPSRQSSTTSTSSSIRKFTPDLVETVRGSYRRRAQGQASPEVSHSPPPNHLGFHSPERSPTPRKPGVPQTHESRFSAANLAKRLEKRHSFIVPDLPSIASDSSGESANDSSGATSPTTVSADGKSAKQKRSTEDRVEEHLLDLAARVAERQLQEAALAAFPNEHDYQPVDHYAQEESDDEESSKPGIFSPFGGIHVSRFRRDSAADLDFELSKMRAFRDEIEKAEEELRKQAAARGESRFSAAALAQKKGIPLDKQESPAKAIGQWQKGMGLAQMRSAASPPMLGSDIKFPFSLSPKTTRCDVDQAPVPRHQDSDGDVVMDDQPLWAARILVEHDKDTGLWMGTCAKGTNTSTPHPETTRRSGILTPAVEVDDPFNSVSMDNVAVGLQHLPLTPSTSRNDPSMDNISIKLELEKEIDEEFNDAFVTQIYNYLSLGYPSLAHPFDDELSKISRIPVEDLRKDDRRTDAKGYVGAPEGHGLDAQAMQEGKCARWTALRLYVREWARQQPSMTERYPEAWGVRARRGSWAI